MAQKTVPFNLEDIKRISQEYPTPFYIYDKVGMLNNAESLLDAFSWNKGFKEYFAVKATPTPEILRVLKSKGFGADCSSYGELLLCEKVGILGEEIMFTSNNTQLFEFQKAKELGAIINLDDISHITFLEEHNFDFPELMCFRYNPGPSREGNVIIGDPKEAKYGFTKEQLIEGYKRLKELGVNRFGLHTMVASNELDYTYIVETAKMLIELVSEIQNELDISFEFINLGGGIGIPYEEHQESMNLKKLGEEIEKVYFSHVELGNISENLNIYMENGRMVTGPYGYLITQAIHKKDIYKNYIGVDACMANLMRPGMYEAYHHIIVLGKEDEVKSQTYDVVGSLCENNDKFAVNRELPKIDSNDYLVICDSGAHGHSMGFQYNAKLRCAELLMDENKKVKLIRRAETYEDYFSTTKDF